MTANVALYHSTYEDFQTTQFVNQVFIVGNAGEVTSQGIEADVLWQATDTLRLGFSGAYADAQYEDFPGQPFDAELGADISYSDDYFLTQDQDDNLIQDSYSLINLRAALRDKDNRWELVLLGRNVTDEIYIIAGGGVPTQNGAFFGASNHGAVYELQFNWFFDWDDNLREAGFRQPLPLLDL
ncbi:MAG: TonB-dependent receptor [Pseudomonadota bacterium]